MKNDLFNIFICTYQFRPMEISGTTATLPNIIHRVHFYGKVNIAATFVFRKGLCHQEHELEPSGNLSIFRTISRRMT